MCRAVAHLSPCPEELAQQCRRFARTQPALHIDAVVVALGNERVEHATGRAGFGIGCAIDDPRDPCVHQRHCAHRARLQSHVQRRTWNAMIAETFAGIAQRADLGVRARITECDVAVPSFAEDGSVPNQHRADRHFAIRVACMRGKFQRALHERDVLF